MKKKLSFADYVVRMTYKSLADFYGRLSRGRQHEACLVMSGNLDNIQELLNIIPIKNEEELRNLVSQLKTMLDTLKEVTGANEDIYASVGNYRIIEKFTRIVNSLY